MVCFSKPKVPILRPRDSNGAHGRLQVGAAYSAVGRLASLTHGTAPAKCIGVRIESVCHPGGAQKQVVFIGLLARSRIIEWFLGRWKRGALAMSVPSLLSDPWSHLIQAACHIQLHGLICWISEFCLRSGRGPRCCMLIYFLRTCLSEITCQCVKKTKVCMRMCLKLLGSSVRWLGGTLICFPLSLGLAIEANHHHVIATKTQA